MKKNKVSGKGVGKFVTTILIILVLLLSLSVASKYTAGFTTGFKTFYISANGKDIMSVDNGYKISVSKPLKVDVKYVFDGKSDINGYSVLVEPNRINGEDFDFSLDGDVYSFQGEKDLTAGFDIEKSETYFTIKPKGGIVDILKAVYPNYTDIQTTKGGYDNMFSLVVTSYNGEASVKLNFSLDIRVTGVNLDKGGYEYVVCV